ncbi:MAG: hypothetical protein OHK0039_38490 [Bacteroidia bacterium]
MHIAFSYRIPGILLLLFLHTVAPAQTLHRSRIALQGTGIPSRTRIEAPRPVQSRAGLPTLIEVSYTGFPPAAQAAFQYAVDIWAAEIISDFPISIEARYTPLAGATLGQATTTMVSGFAGAPIGSTAYPIAFANSLTGCDLDPQGVDVVIDINSTASWHTDPYSAPGAGDYDLATVALHEIAHGLGQVSTFNYDDGVAPNECLGTAGVGCYSLTPFVFDRFVVNGIGTLLLSQPNYSPALTGNLTGNDLFWSGLQATANNGGTRPRLYAPATYEPGSSIAHLDEATFPAGNPNSLATPALGTAEVIHDLGPVLRGMLIDMGWTLPSGALARFSTPAVGFVGYPHAFTDRSVGAVSWAWDFDNDGTADDTNQDPTYNFPAAGSYPVTLTINGNPALQSSFTVDVFDTPVIPYTNDFEAGSGGFYASDHTCTRWELGTATTSTLGGFGSIGGTQNWVTNLNGTHGNNLTYYLYSPPFYFIGAVGDYFLRFDYRWWAAGDVGINVHYSLDGGGTWAVLGGLQGVDPEADANWYNTASIPALGGEMGWQQFTSAQVYTVSYRINALAGNADVRFRIQFGSGSAFAQEGIQVDNFEVQGAVLPTYDLGLSARAEGSTHVLTWTGERPVSSYEVQRAGIEGVFAAIDTVVGAQHYVDRAPLAGRNTYRLRLLLPGGGSSLSPEVYLYAELAAVAVYPNPFGEWIGLQFPGDAAGEWRFELLTAAGQRVLLHTGQHDGGLVRLAVPADLGPGLYLYRIQSGQQQARGKLIRQ